MKLSDIIRLPINDKSNVGLKFVSATVSSTDKIRIILLWAHTTIARIVRDAMGKFGGKFFFFRFFCCVMYIFSTPRIIIKKKF